MTFTSTIHHDLESLQARIAGKSGALFCVLLANSQPRLGTYVALAEAVQARGHIAVVVHPESVVPSPEELVGFEAVEFSAITAEQVSRLRGVDLFFSSEVVRDTAPPDATTIGIFHSLPDQGLKEGKFTAKFSNNLRQKPMIIRTFDYMVAAVKQRPADWEVDPYSFIQNVYPPAFLRGRRSMLDIVPGGYPKLDYSRRLLASSAPGKHIIYSPTSKGSSLTRVRVDGETIIRGLLESFADMSVVFRPYPTPADMQHGRELAKLFEGHPRFIFDDTVTGIRYQRDGAVAITDSSSSAISFALATGRPLIFADLAGAAEPEAPLVHNPFGFTVASLPALLTAVTSAIDDAPAWERTINEETSRYIYNPGNAAAYLADNLETFASRESHPDWLSIERTPWVPEGGPADKEHLDGLSKIWPENAGPDAAHMREEIANYINEDLGSEPEQGI